MDDWSAGDCVGLECVWATRGEELAALVVELAQQRVVPAAERHGG